MAKKLIPIVFFFLFLCTSINALTLCNVSYYIVQPKISDNPKDIENCEHTILTKITWRNVAKNYCGDIQSANETKRIFEKTIKNKLTEPNSDNVSSTGHWSFTGEYNGTLINYHEDALFKILKIDESRPCINEQELAQELEKIDNKYNYEKYREITEPLGLYYYNKNIRIRIISTENYENQNNLIFPEKAKNLEEKTNFGYTILETQIDSFVEVNFYAFSTRSNAKKDTFNIALIEESNDDAENQALVVLVGESVGNDRIDGGNQVFGTLIHLVWLHAFTDDGVQKILDDQATKTKQLEEELTQIENCLEEGKTNYLNLVKINSNISEIRQSLETAEKISLIKPSFEFDGFTVFEEYIEKRQGSLNNKLEDIQKREEQLNSLENKKEELFIVQNYNQTQLQQNFLIILTVVLVALAFAEFTSKKNEEIFNAASMLFSIVLLIILKFFVEGFENHWIVLSLFLFYVNLLKIKEEKIASSTKFMTIVGLLAATVRFIHTILIKPGYLELMIYGAIWCYSISLIWDHKQLKDMRKRLKGVLMKIKTKLQDPPVAAFLITAFLVICVPHLIKSMGVLNDETQRNYIIAILAGLGCGFYGFFLQHYFKNNK